MDIIPVRDAQAWASFNSRFRLILNPLISLLCFLIVWMGSVYGIQKMFEHQYPGVSWLIAASIALAIQRLNMVAVHYSTRMVAAWFAGGEALKSNEHQRMAGPDYFIGTVGLIFTICICTVDFRANKEGNEAIADQITIRPEDKAVDTRPHEMILKTAASAVDAEKAAEAAERAQFDAKVDAAIGREKRSLESRQRQIYGKSWATSELKQIAHRLSSIERTRKEQKAAFVPKKSDVAKRQNEYAAIATTQGSLLQGQAARIDTLNTSETNKYHSKRERREGGMFLIYLAGMFLWHLCHGFRAYRALKYDEIHPEGNNPIFGIINTIGNGISNALWKLQAKIYDLLPEEEIHGLTSTKALEQASSGLCRDVYSFILSNQGCKEMVIYTSFHPQPLSDVRQCLRVLKTAKLIFESSGTWTADQTQRDFLFNPAFP